MDPLAAFSLACGVIQVVDFCTNILAKSRQLYIDGASSENMEIESMATQLTGLSTKLKIASIVPSPGPTLQLYHDDQDLRKLAQRCSETATEVLTELPKTTFRGGWNTIVGP